MFISDNSECFTVRRSVKRAAAVCRGNMLLLMMAVLEDIFPLDLCTPST